METQGRSHHPSRLQRRPGGSSQGGQGKGPEPWPGGCRWCAWGCLSPPCRPPLLQPHWPGQGRQAWEGAHPTREPAPGRRIERTADTVTHPIHQGGCQRDGPPSETPPGQSTSWPSIQQGMNSNRSPRALLGQEPSTNTGPKNATQFAAHLCAPGAHVLWHTIHAHRNVRQSNLGSLNIHHRHSKTTPSHIALVMKTPKPPIPWGMLARAIAWPCSRQPSAP
jgi:hypothetical protein